MAEIKDVENLTDKGLREVIKRALESAVRDPGWLDNHGLANKDLGGAILLVLTNALVPSIRSNMTCITELAIPEAILAKLRDRARKGPCAPPRPCSHAIHHCRAPASASATAGCWASDSTGFKPLLGGGIVHFYIDARQTFWR